MPTTVVHCKKEKYDIYIGRPGFWGNPFTQSKKEEAIEKHKEWIKEQPRRIIRLPELKGKVLGCWCKPKPCHGDTLAEMADTYIEVQTTLFLGRLEITEGTVLRVLNSNDEIIGGAEITKIEKEIATVKAVINPKYFSDYQKNNIRFSF